ncbi:MAG: hypothetical protein NT165_03985 [Candidatus Falkowbacteria bacterium]|nr:hypothetical protein [Candidatus Falkowbacteria bacterium]
MENIQIEKIKNIEEFFLVFNGLCKIAESAFNRFDEEMSSSNPPSSNLVAKEVSYLMSITFVIIGMRGQYAGFRGGDDFTPFIVSIDGMEYDQKYLYKMNDYFTSRFDEVLGKVQELAPEYYEPYKLVWQNY